VIGVAVNMIMAVIVSRMSALPFTITDHE